MIKSLDINIYIKSLFLLIAFVTGNYIADTFGCTIQKLFHRNQITKHIKRMDNNCHITD